MTPKFSLVAIPVLAALALVPAAWGNHQYGDAAPLGESSAPQPNLRAVLASDSAESARAAKAAALAFPSRRLVGDNYREPPKPVSRATPIAASDSGRQIEWPQIAMGFGLGILLAVGLFLATRYTRIRTLAH